ncbi:MAG: UDP-3-O-[3-hydroxymyristoyl] N-acetylglucosamine deacetylase, partial [Caulobacteraceae bacterium]|nr:UDP-3-O-[3-hydroxymyristoyl] N-acetylglucosamine deacetylase [Caulobacteraceae bacterium]
MSISAYHQHTVAGPAIFAGIGLHTGEHVRVCIRPAGIDCGIQFVRTDIKDRDNQVRVSPASVVRTQLGTVIGNAEGVTVSTIEHLMAALAALSIDNAIVE